MQQAPLVSTSRSGEIRSLTALRMIAALLVFAHHFSGIPYQTQASNLFEAIVIEGHIGVTIFFTLSGFLITHRYFQAFRDGRQSLYQYVVKRIARIYPLYYTLLLVLFVQIGVPIFTTRTLPLWTLTQGYFGSFQVGLPAVPVFTSQSLPFWGASQAYFANYQLGLPIAWSLTTEEAFYFLVPLVFLSYFWLQARRVLSTRNPLIVLALVLSLWTLVLAIVGIGLITFSDTSGVGAIAGFMGNTPLMVYKTIFFRFSNFGVGVFGAILYRQVLLKVWQQQRGRWLAWGLLITGTIGIILCDVLLNNAGGVYKDGEPFNYGIALFAGVLILALTHPQNRIAQILSTPLPVYLGRISYGLYLLQFLRVIETIPFVYGALILVQQALPGLPFAVIYYVLLTLVSIVLHESVENYGSRAVIWVSQRLRAPTVLAVESS